MNDNDIVYIGRNIDDSDRFLLTKNRYYIIKGEYKDMIDEDEYVVVTNDWGTDVNVKKSRFDSRERVSYGYFKMVNEGNKF